MQLKSWMLFPWMSHEIPQVVVMLPWLFQLLNHRSESPLETQKLSSFPRKYLEHVTNSFHLISVQFVLMFFLNHFNDCGSRKFHHQRCHSQAAVTGLEFGGHHHCTDEALLASGHVRLNASPRQTISGWWLNLTPLKNMNVNWDHEIPDICGTKK